MKTIRFLTVACVSLAISFMFSCSSGGVDEFQPPSSSSSPPSGTVLCLLGSSCVTLGISDCLEHGTPVAFCPSDGVSSSSSVRSSSSVSGSGTSSSSSGGNTDCTDNSYGAGPSLAYEGKTYKTVKIGCQTWMAENLDYAVEGSKCYDGDPANCTKYGRLYDWATAMALDASCNSSSCSNLIQTKHRGICPTGWHIPSNEEWDELFRFADGTNGTSNPYDSPTAGRYLKATDGWNSYSGIVNEDTYGFAALPGGRFYSVGYNGYWWSSDEGNSSNAYHRYMYYDFEVAFWDINYKDYLISVRCLQD